MLTSPQNMNETPDNEKEGIHNYQLVKTILFYFISSFTQPTLFKQRFKPARIYKCTHFVTVIIQYTFLTILPPCIYSSSLLSLDFSFLFLQSRKISVILPGQMLWGFCILCFLLPGCPAEQISSPQHPCYTQSEYIYLVVGRILFHKDDMLNLLYLI